MREQLSINSVVLYEEADGLLLVVRSNRGRQAYEGHDIVLVAGLEFNGTPMRVNGVLLVPATVLGQQVQLQASMNAYNMWVNKRYVVEQPTQPTHALPKLPTDRVVCEHIWTLTPHSLDGTLLSVFMHCVQCQRDVVLMDDDLGMFASLRLTTPEEWAVRLEGDTNAA